MTMHVHVFKWRDGAGPPYQEVVELLSEVADQADPEAAIALTLTGLVPFDPAELLARLRRSAKMSASWLPVDYSDHKAGGINWVSMLGKPAGFAAACEALGLCYYT